MGTATVIVYDRQRGLLLKEASVIAINKKTGKTIAVGDDAEKMVGKAPNYIDIVKPLSDGVISNFDMTCKMIDHFIKKVYSGSLVKPRVIICVPSGITEVEANAVVRAATGAGARKAYLIEEPVAAALGAGIDISKPNGRMILDIGGGTSDAAVMSFNGVVCKASVKVAGRRMDEAIERHIRVKHKLHIGTSTAEKIKKTIGTALFCDDENITYLAKGIDAQTWLPKRVVIERKEIGIALDEPIEDILSVVRCVLEMTPPELSSDILQNGLIMTGGGSLLHRLDARISAELSIPVTIATNPIECVAKGTAAAFYLVDSLVDGLMSRSIRTF